MIRAVGVIVPAHDEQDLLRRTRRLDPASVWLATTDADTLVPASWLRQQAYYAGHGWDAVVGTIRVADWSGYPPEAASLFRQRYERGPEPAVGPGQPDGSDPGAGRRHPHVHGANLGFRASAYLRAGGFPDLARPRTTGW
jgi:hypothetical protein